MGAVLCRVLYIWISSSMLLILCLISSHNNLVWAKYFAFCWFLGSTFVWGLQILWEDACPLQVINPPQHKYCWFKNGSWDLPGPDLVLWPDLQWHLAFWRISAFGFPRIEKTSTQIKIWNKKFQQNESMLWISFNRFSTFSRR